MEKDFYTYQAQTTPHPLALEVSHANGSYIYDTHNKRYLDFIAGVSANTLGHNNKEIKNAIIDQLDKYTHVMVYGEYIQQPQVALCKAILNTLPSSLDSVYLVNSGTEATEGALKLAKRITGRSELIAAKNAYHGNTQGAMSVCGNEKQNQAFRPLVPSVKFIEFNNFSDIEKITDSTAGVILETIQGGAGFIEPKKGYLKKVKDRCQEKGTLLILDEIQSGIGRTGTFWGFENFNVVPDILITGKGLGGGMPIGAFIASRKKMIQLSHNPKLGHITTFGGHPIIAVSALATLQSLMNSNIIVETLVKEKLFRSLLQHSAIKEIRGRGLMLSLIMNSSELATNVILKCKEKGLLLFWLLFESRAIRITPPLTISETEINEGCTILIESINECVNKS